MGFSEIIIMMLVYGGLFMYASQLRPSNNKIIGYVKSASFIILYGLIATSIWFTYKGEEYHINNHSGYEPVSFTDEAIVMIVGFSIYCLILFVLNISLRRKRLSKI